MPKVMARTYVNVRLLTTESGPGTVLTNTSVWPDGNNMLEVLRNGGGKSTLTAIELFSLVPRLGTLRARMRELFRSSSGPSYVAWKLKRTGKDWAKGYEYLYLICAFERQAGEGQGGEVRRYWAFVPAAYVGEISKLPLTTMENSRLYPTAVDDFKKWANSIQGAVVHRDDSLAEVESELRKNGISPKELATQLAINYDEGGIENFFSKGTTSETFFENCLMTVVRDGVLGDRDDNWLVDAALALTNTARDQQREISKLEVNRSYKDKLELAKDAFETDFAHRKELSELKSRTMKLAEVTEERIGELSVLSEQAELQLQDLAQQERLIDHRDLSIRYYQMYDARCSSDSQAKTLREKSDGLEGELQKLDRDLAIDDAARAFSEWKPQHATVLALENNISALEEKGGKMGAEMQQLQAGAMAAWVDELARACATCEDARQELAQAEQRQREAKEAHVAADGHRLEASSAAGAAREVLAHAQKDLTRASESEPPLEECARILSEPNLMGNYDQERTEASLQGAIKAEAAASKALDQAQRRADEAQAAVSILEDERNEAASQEASARAQRDDLAQRVARAQKAFSELEGYLNQANPKPVKAQIVGAFQSAIHATEAELSFQRTEAQQRRADLHAQLDAFEQRGIMRADPAILSILDELDIPFRMINHVAQEQDIDLETYLRDEPWLADLIFMSEEDALVLSQTLAVHMGADKLVAFVATTDDLDAILAEHSSHVRVCTNANADWVIDPKRWKQKLDEQLDDIAHELETIGFREQALVQANDALMDCRVALKEHDALSGLVEAKEAAQRTWEKAKQRLNATERQLGEARLQLDAQLSCREQAQGDVALAQSIRHKWEAVLETMRTYHLAKDELAQAEVRLAEAKDRYDASSRQVDTAKRLCADAREAFARQSVHCDEIRAHRDAVWSDALSPKPDPLGRDAQTLTTAWNQAKGVLESKREDLGKRLAEMRAELKPCKELAATRLKQLQVACERAGIAQEDAANQVAFIDNARTEQLKSAKSQLERDADKAKREANEAEYAAAKANAHLEAATWELDRRGFGHALPREDCWDINVEEARARIQSQRGELDSRLKSMAAEQSQMNFAQRSAENMSSQLRDAGAYPQFDPLAAPSIDKAGALDECRALEDCYGEAIERRAQSREAASKLIEELVDLPVSDEEIHASAENSQRTLLEALQATSEYKSDSVVRELSEVIGLCDMHIGLLEEQLEEYEDRLQQVATTCASDVADALARLDGIVRDSAINVADKGRPTKRVEFLELSLGGRSVRDIFRSKGRTELVDDIEQRLLPYLRSLIEDALAPLADQSSAQTKAERELSLSKLVRIYAGGGTSPCTVSVKHATYTKLETRRHKDWSTLFKRGAMAQSGAETTLVFFVIYLAITSCVRQTEIPAREDEQRFVILDNPFTKMSDKWAVEFLGRMAKHFGCQMIVKTALQEIASHNVFPYICSYREAKMSADGTIILQLETNADDQTGDNEPRSVDVFATTTEQMTLGW